MRAWAALSFAATFALIGMPAAAQTPRYSATVLAGEGLSYLVTDVAKQRHYFEEQGLDVNFVTMNSAPDMAVAVIGGSGDFTIPIQSVLRAQLKGQGLVAIGATMNQLIHIVVVSNKALARAGVTKDDPLEKRLAALKDLRIGITAAGGGADIIMRMLLARAGLNPDRDATLIALGAGATMVAALETDQIDAYINGSPWPEVPVAHGLGQVIVNIPAGDIKEVSGFPQMTWFTTKKNVEESPGKVQAFVNALYKAELFIHANPDETIQMMRRQFSDVAPEVIAYAVRNNIPAVPTSPIISREQLEITFDTLGTSKQDRAALPFDKVIDNRFAYKAVETIHLR